jgi:hypothetical protein
VIIFKTPAAAAGASFPTDKIFKELETKLNENPGLAKSINSVYAFTISKGDATKTYC